MSLIWFSPLYADFSKFRQRLTGNNVKFNWDVWNLLSFINKSFPLLFLASLCLIWFNFIVVKTTFAVLETLNRCPNVNDERFKRKITHVSTSKITIFKRKIVLAFIEHENFKTISLNGDLILEECNDSGAENDV